MKIVIHVNLVVDGKPVALAIREIQSEVIPQNGGSLAVPPFEELQQVWVSANYTSREHYYFVQTSSDLRDSSQLEMTKDNLRRSGWKIAGEGTGA